MNKKRWIVIAVLGALVAMVFGPSGPAGGFWGREPTPGLEGGVLGALVVYALLEAAFFGFGIAWLALARRVTSVSTGSYLAIGWMLVSWFPHGALHQSMEHDNWAGLAAVEYGFHLTMILAAVVVAREFLTGPDRSAVSKPKLATGTGQ